MHLVLELGFEFPKGMSALDNFFALVQRPKAIWDLVWDICTSNVDNTGLNVEFRPPQSITHFNSLSGDLPQFEVVELLGLVKSGQMSLTTMAREAGCRKKCRMIQAMMITDLRRPDDDDLTWEEVQHRYPSRTSSDDVDQWVSIAKRKGAFTKTTRPKGWMPWINMIKNSNQLQVITKDSASSTRFHYKGCSYNIYYYNALHLDQMFEGKNQQNFGNFFFNYSYFFMSEFFRFFLLFF